MAVYYLPSKWKSFGYYLSIKYFNSNRGSPLRLQKLLTEVTRQLNSLLSTRVLPLSSSYLLFCKHSSSSLYIIQFRCYKVTHLQVSVKYNGSLTLPLTNKSKRFQSTISFDFLHRISVLITKLIIYPRSPWRLHLCQWKQIKRVLRYQLKNTKVLYHMVTRFIMVIILKHIEI